MSFTIIPRLLALLFAIVLVGCGARSAPEPVLDDSPTLGLIAVEPGETAGTGDITAVLSPYRVEVRKLDEPIARSAVEMMHGPGETILGVWLSDILREEMSRRLGERVDVAFQNAGGIRAPLPKGDISYATISRILPFENTVVVFEVSGSELLQLVRQLLRFRGGMVLSGMTVRGSTDGNVEEVLLDGRPLDENRTYRIVTNSFLATGGDRLTTLRNWDGIDTRMVLRDVVADGVRRIAAKGQEITPPADFPRYTIISSGEGTR